jgi:AraC family transcriptional regulator of adaptative response / DNA-3-methyladenine glycosylase II
VSIDPIACYRAVKTRDSRFDGSFFTCVATTGIYCRPICPARTPHFENCRFVPSAAAAQAAGFRPCLRCRPELSPDMAAFRGTESSIARALALIHDGALDADRGVSELAERVGLGERQLRRLFERHLGASPISVAQTRRVLFSKQLVEETNLSMAEVALASGFGSVRRFNAVFSGLYGRTPASLRQTRTRNRNAAVTLRLGYRPPYDWDGVLAFLRTRALPGIELVDGDRYVRSIELEGMAGSLEVRPGRGVLLTTLRLPSVRALPGLVARVRRAFDLDADVGAISEHLARDPKLAPLVRERPGLRTPGGWDGFEQAIRALLGQQISVAAARTLAIRLVALAGSDVSPDQSGNEHVTRLFPSPARLLATDLSSLGMPAARRSALHSLARAASQASLFDRGAPLPTALARLGELPGFGAWTAEYVALRALGHADAFPAGDVVLRRVAGNGSGLLSERELVARAEAWRPFRAYAAQHLWTAAAVPQSGAAP